MLKAKHIFPPLLLQIPIILIGQSSCGIKKSYLDIPLDFQPAYHVLLLKKWFIIFYDIVKKKGDKTAWGLYQSKTIKIF